MLIEKVRNLSDEDLYVYGTSGALTRLPSEPFSEIGMMAHDKLPAPRDGEYYILPEKGIIKDMILRDWRYSHCALIAQPYGEAMNGEKLVKLKDHFSKKYELVTDGVRPQEVNIDKEYFDNKYE